MQQTARAQAVRDLHLGERAILSAELEPLPDCPLHVDLTKRTLPGLAVVSGTLSGLQHAVRPSAAAASGADDLLVGINVRGRSMARQHHREDLTLGDGDAFFATRRRRLHHHASDAGALYWLSRAARGSGAVGRTARRYADPSSSGADVAYHICERDR
jgi:hypothetical protein